jgi:hypothetical protein
VHSRWHWTRVRCCTSSRASAGEQASTAGSAAASVAQREGSCPHCAVVRGRLAARSA